MYRAFDKELDRWGFRPAPLKLEGVIAEVQILPAGSLIETPNVDYSYPLMLLIPRKAKFISVIADRRDMLDGDPKPTLSVGLALSLDEGKHWGGTYTEWNGGRPMQYPLSIGAETNGVHHDPREWHFTPDGVDSLKVPNKDMVRGVGLPKVGNKHRCARVFYRAYKQLKTGIKVVYQ